MIREKPVVRVPGVKARYALGEIGEQRRGEHDASEAEASFVERRVGLDEVAFHALEGRHRRRSVMDAGDFFEPLHGSGGVVEHAARKVVRAPVALHLKLARRAPDEDRDATKALLEFLANRLELLLELRVVSSRRGAHVDEQSVTFSCDSREGFLRRSEHGGKVLVVSRQRRALEQDDPRALEHADLDVRPSNHHFGDKSWFSKACEAGSILAFPMAKARSREPAALQKIRASKAEKVKVAITDVDGILRGKYLHKPKFEAALEGGFGFCNVVFGWDAADVCYDNASYTGWHTGYPDALVRLDLDTLP